MTWVLWDNWRMMQCALGTTPTDQCEMRRTTIAGDYDRGRLASSVVLAQTEEGTLREQSLGF